MKKQTNQTQTKIVKSLRDRIIICRKSILLHKEEINECELLLNKLLVGT